MIVVSSFWALEDALKLYRPAYLSSLMDHVDSVSTPETIDAKNHLRLGFHDVEGKTPWNTPPSSEDIGKIIEVALRWKNSGEPILAHCTAGVSRSPAAGLILSSIRQPDNEAEQAMHLREQAPYCRPNKLMIKLADQALSLKGKLIDATANMGEPDYEGRPQPFVLNLY